jgi:hypothetical protein
MSQFHDGMQPPNYTNGPAPQGYLPQQPVQPPKKKHTARNIVLAVIGGFVLLVGALSSVDTKAPVEVTSKAGSPTTAPTAPATTAPATTQAPKATTKTTAPKATRPAMTESQKQAIGSAESYLAFTAFSRKGLIHQLSSKAGEGFSLADATYAVDHIKVNWNEQAAKAAKSYLEMTHFSRQGLIHQLESDAGDGFTHAQAVYGVTKAGL